MGAARAYLRVGHEDHAAVAPRSADVRETDAGVSCGAFDDRSARLQAAGRASVLRGSCDELQTLTDLAPPHR